MFIVHGTYSDDRKVYNNFYLKFLPGVAWNSWWAKESCSFPLNTEDILVDSC